MDKWSNLFFQTVKFITLVKSTWDQTDRLTTAILLVLAGETQDLVTGHEEEL